VRAGHHRGDEVRIIIALAIIGLIAGSASAAINLAAALAMAA
jgi:hypothetical protein